jgi:hypothetical protein
MRDYLTGLYLTHPETSHIACDFSAAICQWVPLLFDKAAPVAPHHLTWVCAVLSLLLSALLLGFQVDFSDGYWIFW